MSWYKIDYACGHTGREQIYGKTSERQRIADYRGNNKVCKDCWIKGRAEADKKAALERAGIKPETIKSGGENHAETTESSADLQERY